MSTTEQAYGREFVSEAMSQIGNVMIGREHAKFAGIVMLAAGVNGVFAGGTGKFKTELALALPNLVHDIYDENVTEIPIQNDLTGMQLIGGESVFEKEVTSADGVTTLERSKTTLPGLINEGTQAVVLDEVNRGSAKTTESLLGMLESRRIVTLAGARNVPNLEYAVATMNPHEAFEVTQPVAHATVSRFSVGAIFDRGDRAMRVDNVVRIGELPKGGKIEPITDLATIHKMRREASFKQIPKSLDRKIAEMSVDVSDALWDEVNLDDGEERISVQARKLARVITILSGETVVNEEAVNHAMGMIISARVGMAHSDAVNRGPSIVSQILSSTA